MEYCCLVWQSCRKHEVSLPVIVFQINSSHRWCVSILHLQRSSISLLRKVWKLAAVIFTDSENTWTPTCFILSPFYQSYSPSIAWVVFHFTVILQFVILFKYHCFVCSWYNVCSMCYISLIDFSSKGEKIMLATWEKGFSYFMTYIHCFVFYDLSCLLSPTMLEQHCQLCAGCIHALAGLSPFATVAIFFLEMF
jgi:hypothetical protein